MAVNSLGFNIEIRVIGGFESKLASAQSSVQGLANATKDLERSQARSQSIALKQAASFGILGIGLQRLGSHLTDLGESSIGFLGNIIKHAAHYQTALAGVRLFFGENAEQMTAAVVNLANQTDLSLEDVTNIARRIGGIGLSGNQAVRAVNILSQGISTLTGAAKTRALAGAANIFENFGQSSRLLHAGFTEAEKAAVSAAKGTAKHEMVLKLLESRFSHVNEIMGGTFIFRLKQFGQIFQDMVASRAVQGPLQNMTDLMAKLTIRFTKFTETVEFQKNVIEPLADIFTFLLSPLTKLMKWMHDVDFVPRMLLWLGDHKILVQYTLMAFTVGTLLTGAFLSLSGALLIAAGSMALFRSQIMPVMGSVKGVLGEAGLATKRAGIGLASKAGLFGRGGAGVVNLGAMVGTGGAEATAIGIGTGAVSATSALGGMLAMIGSLLIAAAALSAIFGSLFGLIKSALGPTVFFLSEWASNFADIGEGIRQVIAGGEMTEELFLRLNAKGLWPIFRILGWISFRLSAIFEGFYAAFSKLGPAFSILYEAFSTTFKGIGESISSLMEVFGFFIDGSQEGLQGLAYLLGTGLAVTLGTVIDLISILVAGFSAGIKFLVGGFDLIVGGIQWVTGEIYTAILKMNSLTGGRLLSEDQKMLAETFSGMTGDATKNFKQGLGLWESMSKEEGVIKGAGGDIWDMLSKRFDINANLSIDGKQVEEVVTERQDQAASQGNAH